MNRMKAVGRASDARAIDIMALFRRLALLGVLTWPLANCISPSFTLGVAPPVERLSELRRGESRKADVIRVLGQSQGEGASRLPDFPGYRTILSYEFMRLEEATAKLTILLVFLDDNVFDGYLWFGDVHEVKVTS